MNQETLAKMEDLDKVVKNMKEYATQRALKEIRVDMKDFIKKPEMDLISADLGYLKKDMSGYVQQEEMLQRIQSLHAEYLARLGEKPSTKMFNRKLSEYDSKLATFNSFLDQRVQEMNEKVLKLDRDVGDLDSVVKKC